MNVDSAEYYYQKSFQLSDAHQFPLVKKLNAEQLTHLYEQKADFKKANQYLHISKELNEENLKEQNDKKINEIETDFNQRIKQQELINQQKKKNVLFISICLGSLTLSLIAFLFLRLQKNKLKVRKAENILLAEELEKKNKELTIKTLEMKQANELINYTQKELAELKVNQNSSTKKNAQQNNP